MNQNQPSNTTAPRSVDQQQACSALALGWTVERKSLYDEEGVEGWCWTSQQGVEHDVIGGWNEPPPFPDGVEPNDEMRDAKGETKL